MRPRLRFGARAHPCALPRLRRALLAALLLLAAGPPAPLRSPTTTRAISPTPTGCRSGSTRCGTRRRGQYRAGSGGVDALRQRADAAHAQRRGAAGPQRPRAQRPPRAADRAARSCRRRVVHRAHPRASRAGLADARARLDELDVRAPRRGQHLVFDAEIVDGLVARLEGAARARPARRDDGRLIADRIHRVGVVALLALADHPPQPGQLVRADVRGRRDRDRATPSLLRRDLTRAARPLRRGVARRAGGAGNFGARAALPLPAATRSLNAPRRTSTRPSTRTSCSRSCASTTRRARAGMAPLSRAGRAAASGAGRGARSPATGPTAGYLNWDTGLGLRALAPGEEARPRPAGADRDRPGRASSQPRARVGALGQVDARPRPALLRAPAARRRAGCPTRCCFELYTVPQGVGSARLAAARLQANAARAVAAGLGRMRRRRAAARCTPTTPTSAASP